MKVNMNPQLIFYSISLITASLILCIGIILLCGFLLPAYVPVNYRIVMGCLMVLYGTYRTIMAVVKIRNMNRPERLDGTNT